MYYIPQLHKSSCGMACLKMLLAMVQKDDGYLYLQEDEKHGPYSYQELVTIAQRYDVTLIGVQYSDKDDLRHITEFPLILSMFGPNDTKHAVLISQRKGKRLKVHDPAKGVYWQRIDKFITRWDGTALAVNHVESHPYPYYVIDTKDKKGEITSYLLQALAAIFIAIATFFIKPDGKIVIPIIFVFLSLISEILLRFTLLKRMQRCDKYLRRFLPYVRSDDYYEFYKRSQEYKRCSMSMGLNFVFSLLIVILIATVSLINSLNFVILIIASILAAYLDAFFFTPYKRSINQEISQEEEDIAKIETMERMEMQVKTMEVKAYRFAYLEFSKKIVVGLLLVIASIALSISMQAFTLTNVVFNTCLGVLLYQSLAPLFNYDDRLAENLFLKAKINNILHQNDEKNSH